MTEPGEEFLGARGAQAMDALEAAFRRTARKQGISVDELFTAFNNDPHQVVRAMEELDWEGDIAEPFKTELMSQLNRQHTVFMNAEARRLSITSFFGPKETNPFAQAFSETHGATLVKEINEETQRSIRRTITDGIREGQGSSTIRVRVRDRVGLLERHSVAVQLHFDTLRGKGISFLDAQKSAEKYADRLVKYRAENIARTEMRAALNQATLDGWTLGIQRGDLPVGVNKEWITNIDDRTCPICAPLDGKRQPVRGSFISSIGAIIRPPAHPSCRCSMGLVFPT